MWLSVLAPSARGRSLPLSSALSGVPGGEEGQNQRVMPLHRLPRRLPARLFDCATDLRYKDQRSNGATIRVDHIRSTCRGEAPGWREPVAIARPCESI
jgi:hypothetical protein